MINEKRVAWLKVNEACNFRCEWCIEKTEGYDISKQMSLELAKKLVDIVCEMDISTIVIIGGEPTIWSPLVDFNEYCASRSIKTCLATNGCMFGDDEFWKNYTNSPSDSIYLSIKSIREKQFEDFTNRGSLFPLTMNGIRRIARYNDDVGAEIVLSEYLEKTDILDIAQFVDSCGIKYLTIDICIENNNSANINKQMDLISATYDQIDSMFKEGLTYQLFTPICWWPEDFIQKIRQKKQLESLCQANDGSGVVFDTNGDVVRCYSTRDTVIAKYGLDFQDFDSLSKIFLRFEQTAENRRWEKCVICNITDICFGGCLFNNSIKDLKL